MSFLQDIKEDSAFILEDVKESLFQRNWHVYGYVTEKAKEILKKHHIHFSNVYYSDTGCPYMRVNLSGKRIEYREIEDYSFFIFPDNEALILKHTGLGYLDDGNVEFAECETEYNPDGVLVE